MTTAGPPGSCPQCSQMVNLFHRHPGAMPCCSHFTDGEGETSAGQNLASALQPTYSNSAQPSWGSHGSYENDTKSLDSQDREEVLGPNWRVFSSRENRNWRSVSLQVWQETEIPGQSMRCVHQSAEPQPVASSTETSIFNILPQKESPPQGRESRSWIITKK